MNKIVIFDLDGTLLHSLPDIHYYVNKMLAHFGFPERSQNEVMQFIGNGAKNLVKRSLPDGVSEELVNKCHKYYNEIYTASNSPRTKLFDGVDSALKRLKERGYKLAILTNKPQITTDKIHSEYMTGLNLDMVVGQKDGVKIKPDPATTLSIISKLNGTADNTYFVGDGETDVLTATNSNTKGIAVLWGYRNKQQLESAGAKIFASSFEELLSIIN